MRAVERAERFGIEHRADVVRFLAIRRQLIRARRNQRVQFLRALSEKLHCNRVALGFVFDLAEPPDHFVENLAVVA